MKNIAIIGTGAVGSAAAQAILQSGQAASIRLFDIREESAQACALDLQDACALIERNCRISTAKAAAELADADIIVLCYSAGICANRPDELAANLRELAALAPALQGFAGILLIATNPNDAMVFHARRLAGLPASRVIGTGTSIDSARLIGRIARDLRVPHEAVSAAMLGEHGDTQLGHFSAARVGDEELAAAYAERGVALDTAVLQDFTAYRGHEIFRLKGKTEYAIAAAIARIVSAISRNEKAQLPVSFVQDDALAISQEATLVIAGSGVAVGAGCVLGGPLDDGCVAYSRPAIIGAAGICGVPPLCASAEELAALARSIAAIKALC